jgi:hypothetical protein
LGHGLHGGEPRAREVARCLSPCPRRTSPTRSASSWIFMPRSMRVTRINCPSSATASRVWRARGAGDLRDDSIDAGSWSGLGCRSTDVR